MIARKPEPKYVAQTLAWCNRMRAKAKKKPLVKLPKGVRSDGYSCPCGKATGLYVADYNYSKVEYDDTLYDLPVSVQRFVVAFDNEKLPQYDAEA